MAVKRVIGTPDGPVLPDGKVKRGDTVEVWCDHGHLVVADMSADSSQALIRCGCCWLEWWEDTAKLEKREG